MKKKCTHSIVMLLLVTAIAASVNASPFRIEGGIGVWNHDPDGIINYNGDDIELNKDLNLSDRNDLSVWLRLEHPVPMLPDVKIQYTPIKVEDDASPGRSFTFGNFDFDEALRSELEMDIIDLQLYNHLPFLNMASLKSLDITYGMNFRFLNGQAFIQEIQSINARSRSFSTPLAMFCAGIRLAPVSSFSLHGEIKGTSYSGNRWCDINAEIQISPFTELIFLGIGYRYQDFKIEDVEDVTTDQTMQGWFAELGFRFE